VAPKLFSLIIASCGTTFVHRKNRSARVCIPLHLKGSTWSSCYSTWTDNGFWFESGVMKPWEDGWKRSPNPTAKIALPLADKYPEAHRPVVLKQNPRRSDASVFPCVPFHCVETNPSFLINTGEENYDPRHYECGTHRKLLKRFLSL